MQTLEANDYLVVYMFVTLMMIAPFARADVSIPFTLLLLPLHHFADKLVFLLSENAVFRVFITYNNHLNDF